MTDQLPTHPVRDDRVMAMAVYVLYIAGLVSGVTVLVGVVMAYVLKSGASEPYLSHFVFQIRSFWLSIAFALLGGLLISVGIPLLIVGIGALMIGIGWLIFAALWVWFLVRSVVGLVTLYRGDPYPRPRAWIV
jgi:uncharacterized membrane protein